MNRRTFFAACAGTIAGLLCLSQKKLRAEPKPEIQPKPAKWSKKSWEDSIQLRGMTMKAQLRETVEFTELEGVQLFHDSYSKGRL